MRLWLVALVSWVGYACVDQSVLAQAPPTSARVDTQPLVLVSPDRYAIRPVLQPVRRVTLVAASDGIVRSQDAREGADVRANQEIAQLDRVEALALQKIAQAEVKEQQAALAEAQVGVKTATTTAAAVTRAEARLEAARARAELAQAAVDRCTLRAPFAGRLVESLVSDGQYVSKGEVIAEVVDLSSLRALVPLAREGATVGATVSVTVEGQPVQGRVQAVLPLSEALDRLRELAQPMASAWIVLPNPKGAFEPGQRVLSPSLPTQPLTTVPQHALRNADGKAGPPTVQVIRNEYVTDVPVRVVGNTGPERVQVAGAFRPADALIVSTSVRLQPGTLIRFGQTGNPGAVEGTTPDPSVHGEPAAVMPPPGTTGRGRANTPRPAPTAVPTPPVQPPQTKPAAKSEVPF